MGLTKIIFCFENAPDRNECEEGVECPGNAGCMNTNGSFECPCNAGFESIDGVCFDINQCTAGTHNCHADAECGNIPGLFECTCNPGFFGKFLLFLSISNDTYFFLLQNGVKIEPFQST